MTDRELMQQALDALDKLLDKLNADICDNSGIWDEYCDGGNAMQALRARLAQPEPEPVAWISAEETWLVPKLVISDTPKDGYKPVYTAPPQRECVSCAGLCCQDYEKCNLPCTPRGREQARREWQGLTNEEVRDLWSWAMTVEAERTANTQQHAFARAIEAKLKEKNAPDL